MKRYVFFCTYLNNFTFYKEHAGEEFIYASQFINSTMIMNVWLSPERMGPLGQAPQL
jgi:hypothetical protein